MIRDERQLRYEVKILDDEPLVFDETAPSFLCTPHAPADEARRFLAHLVQKYADEVLQHRPWTCWQCRKPAAHVVHTPLSYLHRDDPAIVDHAQPVCERGGACEQEARAYMDTVTRDFSQPKMTVTT